MRVKYALIFNRKGLNLKPTEKSLIQIEAYLAGKRKYFTTGIYVTASQWNAKRRLIRNHPNEDSLNLVIKKKLLELEGFENAYARKKEPFSLACFDQLKAKAEERKEVASFTEFYKEQLSKEKKTLAYITYSGHRNTLAVLTEYRGNVPFEELNYELIEGFNNFLLSRKLKLNSVEKYHRHLRKYINIAIKKDLFEYRKNPYRLFKIKGEKTTRTALSPTELDRLAALVFSSEEKHLEPIRDMFLLSCYTGLRYSDVVQIRHTHLSEESAGQLLELKAVKTQKQLQLPLFDLFRNPDGKSKPEMIIEKYYRPDGLPFFKGITNQYANRCLKTIVLLARIRKKVSFHTARHTFGTTMASKVPIPVLRELMQHDKLETTQIYLHISNQMIRSQLQNVKW